jgi:hypothetical protein
MNIDIPVSPGELIDKLVILEIKEARITDPAKLKNVSHALELLRKVMADKVPPSQELATLTKALKTENAALWDIEDTIRLHERRKDFGAGFVELARSVYLKNDERARLKRAIDDLLGSELVEVKSYEEYGAGPQ